MLRGDIVKDAFGAYAVLTERSSSASEMTAAKIMDVIARLPGCDGQAADTVSAYTQVKLENAPRLLKVPKSECPDVWIRLHDTNGQNHGRKLKILLYLLNENCTVIHSPDCYGKDNSRKFYWNVDGKKYQIWECLFVHRKQCLFLSIFVDDIKMDGKKQNLAPMWKKLMKHVDIDEPTSFLGHVYLGCTQRECKPNEAIIEQYTKMFESRISAGTPKKLPGWQKPQAHTVAWSYDMEGHAQNCVERYCEIGKQESRATLQSFSSLFGRSSV